MNINDAITLMREARELGASEFSFDTLKISFNNISQVRVIDNIPELSTPDKPNHQEENNSEEKELLAKAEDLALMAIEDPERFEEILANDDESLRVFKEEINQLEDEL
jgi:hypothetical protein